MIAVGALGVATLAPVTPAAADDISFTPKQDVAAGSGPSSIAIGDYNTDSKPDLAVANYAPDSYTRGSVAILLGNGSGGFQNSGTVDTNGSYPTAVATGDFNRDGAADLAVMDLYGGNTSSVDTYGFVMMGNGTGSFTGSSVLVTSGLGNPFSVQVGDVNGDGAPDLVAVGARPRSGGLSPVGLVSSLLGDGTGAFPTRDVVNGGEVRRSVALADLNGDGVLDKATANSGREDFPGTVSSVLGTADAGEGSTSVAVGDFNADGKPDLAVANYTSDNVTVFLSNGTTLAPGQSFPAHDGPRSVTVADFDGDGKQDLAVANAVSQDVSVLRGTGTGSFAAPLHFPTGEMSTLSAVRYFGDGGLLRTGDFDCNGTPDLAVANRVSGSVSILMNSRPGTKPAGCTPDTAGPAVRVVSKSLRMTKAGVVAVKLACPAGEPAGCKAKVKLKTAKKVQVTPTRKRIVLLGKVTKQLASGKTTTAKVKFSDSKRDLVKKFKKVRVKVSVRATDQARNARTTTKTLTLKRS